MANKKAIRGEPSIAPKRARGTTKEPEPRIARVFSILEKQAEQRFERLFVRLIWRLGLVSQKDVRELLQRIEQLERRLEVRRSPPHPKSAARKSSAPFVSGRGVTVIR